MCTVSWQFQRAGYELYFSRDEQRTRVPALPPRVHCRDGVQWIAPHDPVGGGTWILTNSHGLTACVLNSYPAATDSSFTSPPGDRPSRGLLPLEMADAHDSDTCGQRLARILRSGRFSPCHLLCLHPPSTAAWWVWNGTSLQRARDPVHPPLTTSSHDPGLVTRSRLQAFAALAGANEPTAEWLRRFHQCPGQTANAATVRMSRPDARTVSLTRVLVCGNRIRMAYFRRDQDAGFQRAVLSPIRRQYPEPMKASPC